MFINFANETIDLSKAEAKKAGIIGSEEYKTLNEARAQYTNFRVIVLEKKTINSSKFKGMPCDFMAQYVESHDENGALMAEFSKLRNDKSPYGVIKKWFFEKYPQFKEFTTRAQWILAA